MTATSIRDHLATALHADRDHTRDGVELGAEPICNCYTLADAAIQALGGVKVERQYGTLTRWSGGEVMEMDYRVVNYTRDPKDYTHETLRFATPWVEDSLPAGEEPSTLNSTPEVTEEQS